MVIQIIRNSDSPDHMFLGTFTATYFSSVINNKFHLIPLIILSNDNISLNRMESNVIHLIYVCIYI